MCNAILGQYRSSDHGGTDDPQEGNDSEAVREVLDTPGKRVLAGTSHTASQEEWAAWAESMAGAWQGDFERPPQDEYERREELP